MSFSEFKAVVYTGELDPLVKTVTVKRDPDDLIPGKDELLIRVNACACNPTDYKHFLAKWGENDNTVGSDLAGVVVKVGGGKETDGKFNVGDFVSSFVHGGYRNKPMSGAFQEFVVVPKATTLKYANKLHNIEIPAYNKEKITEIQPSYHIETFEAAASLSLGLCTVGMSLHNQMKLKATNKASNINKWILIWGGTTATGYLAIQIAKQVYGLQVITTANKSKYQTTLNNIGADLVVDYKDIDCVKQIKELTSSDGGISYALDCVSSPDTFNKCYKALKTKDNGTAYFDNLLCLTTDILEDGLDSNKDVKFGSTLAYLVIGEDQNLNGFIVKSSEEIAKDHIEFLEIINKLINTDKILHLPLALLPNGLDSANEGLKMLEEGRVSCHKVVFSV